MNENNMPEYVFLKRSITSEAGVIAANQPIKTSILQPGDYEIFENEGMFSKWPKTAEDLMEFQASGAPETKVLTKNIDGTDLGRAFSNDNLEYPRSYKEAEKFFQKIGDKVLRGEETKERVHRMSEAEKAGKKNGRLLGYMNKVLNMKVD